jgi:hypothetical protein
VEESAVPTSGAIEKGRVLASGAPFEGGSLRRGFGHIALGLADQDLSTIRSALTSDLIRCFRLIDIGPNGFGYGRAAVERFSIVVQFGRGGNLHRLDLPDMNQVGLLE